MTKRLAFFGGSFNPPTIAHRRIVEDLLVQKFDFVLVKPCGYRKDKPELKNSCDRKERVLQNFNDHHEQFLLDLNAMDHPMVPTVLEWESLQSKYPEYAIWIVTGTDLFEDDGQGTCQVQQWIRGKELFESAHFWIYPRPTDKTILWPPHFHFQKEFKPIAISSSELRELESKN